VRWHSTNSYTLLLPFTNYSLVPTLLLKSSYIQGDSIKSRPPTTFNDIFALAESFSIKFHTLIGNLYPRMCTDFRLFILTCNEMALILSRSPIIFTVSSLDYSAGNKNAEFQLNGKDVIGQ